MATDRTAEFTSSPALTIDGGDELMTGEAVALDLRPTGFVLRAAGTVIDWIVYLGLYLAAAAILLPNLIQWFDLDTASLSAIGIISLVLMLVVVPTTVELLTHGKSVGRLVVGARIVRDDGGAIGFRHAFIRALTAMLEIFMTFGGLAAIVSLLNSRSKRLGDLLAGTYSQYERVSKLDPAVYGVPTELTEWALTADVGRLPDRLSRRVTAFLQQAAGLSPTTRDRLGRELANETSVWVSPLPRVHPELFLAAVTALRRDRESTALDLQAKRLASLSPALEPLPHQFPTRG